VWCAMTQPGSHILEEVLLAQEVQPLLPDMLLCYVLYDTQTCNGGDFEMSVLQIRLHIVALTFLREYTGASYILEDLCCGVGKVSTHLTKGRHDSSDLLSCNHAFTVFIVGMNLCSCHQLSSNKYRFVR
jgi:hypothetical protein